MTTWRFIKTPSSYKALKLVDKADGIVFSCDGQKADMFILPLSLRSMYERIILESDAISYAEFNEMWQKSLLEMEKLISDLQ